ncbi:L-Aspartase-like protein [Amylocarpus encephaloides]|uniref:L-Aspartase-like protein n=1 Tax=Amylocarpus encephaloides TaxID=45428 RepID=A0A9P7YHA3_9HELO|nr:L-Aspartase-like protein [Amylocarpus encephaloides]
MNSSAFFRRSFFCSASKISLSKDPRRALTPISLPQIVQKRTMAVSALDSRIYRSLFGTEEIRNIFSDTSYLHSCILVELALARAQSTLGVIPSQTGHELTTLLQSSVHKLDFPRLERETEIVGYPILPLITQLQTLAPGESGKYIHWGATTQDIMDTASILQVRDGLTVVEKLLADTCRSLERLASKYRDTPMAGRTHLQHALPVTFGYKCAVYLSSLRRHQKRLEQLKERALLVQYGGAAGTLASLGNGDEGVKVRAELAKELDLQDPDITWHVARDGIGEVLNFLALLGGSLGKVALDLMIMSSNEFSEVSEPFVEHRGASSTMPQKRNPISCELILAASKILRANASLGLDAMVSDFERASGPWHLEWHALPSSFVLAVGALTQADFVLSGLVVNEGAMERNLKSTRGLIVGERVMMELATKIGRGRAHDVVYGACKKAIEEDTSLLEALRRSEEVTGVIGEEELAGLCEEKGYLGASGRMVDHVLARL